MKSALLFIEKYSKGAGRTILAAFGIWGIILTISQFDETIEVSQRLILWCILGIIVVIIWIIRAIINFYNFEEAINGIHIESYDTTQELFIGGCSAHVETDHVVSIKLREDKLDAVIGYGVVHLSAEEHVEINIIQTREKYKETWSALKQNDKTCLDKVFYSPFINYKVYQTIQEEERKA